MCNDEARLQNRYLSRGCACHVEEEKRIEQTMRPRWYRTAAEYVSAIGNRRRSEVSDGRSLRMRPLLRFQVLGKRTTSWLCGSLQSSDWLPEGRNVCRPGRSTQRVRFFRRTSNDKAFLSRSNLAAVGRLVGKMGRGNSVGLGWRLRYFSYQCTL